MGKQDFNLISDLIIKKENRKIIPIKIYREDLNFLYEIKEKIDKQFLGIVNINEELILYTYCLYVKNNKKKLEADIYNYYKKNYKEIIKKIKETPGNSGKETVKMYAISKREIWDIKIDVFGRHGKIRQEDILRYLLFYVPSNFIIETITKITTIISLYNKKNNYKVLTI